jgi:hypothetical protein
VRYAAGVSVSWRQGRAGGTLLLALLGAWVSHTAVYVQLRGVVGLHAELLASPHRYMLPAAALILAGAWVGVGRVWRRWRDLGRRLEVVRAAVDAVRRGLRVAPPPSRLRAGAPTPAQRLLTAWAAVAPLQLILYVLQENLEAQSAHQPVPGLAVLWSDHWTAVLIHGAVALFLCAVTVLLTRRVAERARALVAHERLLGRLLRSAGAVRTAISAVLESPIERFGPQLWSRPPPLLARR